jgi:hypothetical protein
MKKQISDFQHLAVANTTAIKGGEDKPIIIITDDSVGRG